MATPRKRFFTVECSLYREPWPRELKMTLVMLGMHMTDRWAADSLTPRQATTAHLSVGDLLTITGTETRDEAHEVLRQLASRVSIKLTVLDNGFAKIEWPKLAKTQWSKSRYSGSKQGNVRATYSPKVAPSDSDSDPDPHSQELREESSVAKPPPDAVRKPRKGSAPETNPEALEFSAKFLRALGAAHQDPPIKLPTDSAFAGWQREARLMLATDGRSFDDAKRVASWLFNDQGQAAHFWRKNVLSVGTFRKQFDRLAAAMKAPHYGGRDEFHGSKILRYLATAEAGDPRPRASGAVQDPEPPILRLAELPPGER